MAKYAPIAPTAILKKLQADYPLLFGTYHLVLAPEVEKYPDSYVEIFGREHHPEYFTILDNGAAEGEKAHTLMADAYLIDASCVCLPDALEDAKRTIRMVDEFIQKHGRRPSRKLMAIPQGKNPEEIMNCASMIVRILGDAPDYWGIPRWFANKFGSRLQFINELCEDLYQKDLYAQPNIHLLGMSRKLKDDLMCSRHPRVMGIDSANPIIAGMMGDFLRDTQKHYPRQIDYANGDTWKFWEETELTDNIRDNIQDMRMLIG